MVGLWLVLVSSGAVVVALVDQRPRRRVTLLCLLGVALALLCAAPAGWFWTFAVSHAPAGGSCPECAVDQFLNTGPTAGSYDTDPAAFDQVLCPDQRA